MRESNTKLSQVGKLIPVTIALMIAICAVAGCGQTAPPQAAATPPPPAATPPPAQASYVQAEQNYALQQEQKQFNMMKSIQTKKPGT